MSVAPTVSTAITTVTFKGNDKFTDSYNINVPKKELPIDGTVIYIKDKDTITVCEQTGVRDPLTYNKTLNIITVTGHNLPVEEYYVVTDDPCKNKNSIKFFECSPPPIPAKPATLPAAPATALTPAAAPPVALTPAASTPAPAPAPTLHVTKKFMLTELINLRNVKLILKVDVYKRTTDMKKLNYANIDINDIKELYINNQIRILDKLSEDIKNPLITFLCVFYTKFNNVDINIFNSDNVTNLLTNDDGKSTVVEALKTLNITSSMSTLISKSNINKDSNISHSKDCVIIDNQSCQFYKYFKTIEKDSNIKILYIILVMINNLFYVIVKNKDPSIIFNNYFLNNTLKLSDIAEIYNYNTDEIFLEKIDSFIIKELNVTTFNNKDATGITKKIGITGGAKKTKKRNITTKKQSRKTKKHLKK